MDDAARAWDLFSHEGEAQWFATKEDRASGTKRTLGGRLTSIDQLIGTIRNAENLNWNLYLQANPSRRTGRVKLSRQDITAWRYIVVDLDPTSDCIAPPDFNKVAHRLFSGRGYQCWVPVIGATPADMEHAERIMSGYMRYHQGKPWLNGWIIDTACSDLARVVRCPGSINQKSGKRAVLEFDRGEGKHIDDLRALASPAPETVAPIDNATKLEHVLPHLTVLAKRFIMDGVESPGRHTAAWHTIKLLCELGVPQPIARNWMLEGATSCVPCDAKFISDVLKGVAKVYGASALCGAPK